MPQVFCQRSRAKDKGQAGAKGKGQEVTRRMRRMRAQKEQRARFSHLPFPIFEVALEVKFESVRRTPGVSKSQETQLKRSSLNLFRVPILTQTESSWVFI